jgi:hypothetical protein
MSVLFLSIVLHTIIFYSLYIPFMEEEDNTIGDNFNHQNGTTTRRRSIPYVEYCKLHNLEIKNRVQKPTPPQELSWCDRLVKYFITCVQCLRDLDCSTVRPCTGRSAHRTTLRPTVHPTLPHQAPSGKGGKSSHKGRNE